MHPEQTAIARIPLDFKTPHRWTPSDRVFNRMDTPKQRACGAAWWRIGVQLATVIKRDAEFLSEVPAGVICVMPVQHAKRGEPGKYNEIATVLRNAGRSQGLFLPGTHWLWDVFTPESQADCAVTLTAMELLDAAVGPFTDKLCKVGT